MWFREGVVFCNHIVAVQENNQRVTQSEGERIMERMSMRTSLEVLSSFESEGENQRMSMRSLGLEFL